MVIVTQSATLFTYASKSTGLAPMLVCSVCGMDFHAQVKYYWHWSHNGPHLLSVHTFVFDRKCKTLQPQKGLLPLQYTKTDQESFPYFNVQSSWAVYNDSSATPTVHFWSMPSRLVSAEARSLWRPLTWNTHQSYSVLPQMTSSTMCLPSKHSTFIWLYLWVSVTSSIESLVICCTSV